MSYPPTVDVAARILGEPVQLDDPAETFHEASRIAPSTIAAQLAGSIRLAADPLLQASTQRASRRHPHRPAIFLTPERLPATTLGQALDRRVSGLAGADLKLADVSTLLEAGYGCRARGSYERRPVPSAGALYPLELYLVARRVVGVSSGVYHFDPYGHRIERLTGEDPSVPFRDAVCEADLAELAAAALVVTTMLPRVRCKYGQRGYRFALLEAGQLAQNVVLTAAALGLSALPYGGFYDRRTDALVGADGVDECTVHVLLLSGGAP